MFRRMVSLAVRTAAWSVVALGALACLAVAAEQVGMGGLVVGLGPGMLLVFVLLTAWTVKRLRQQEAQAVLAYVDQAVQLNLPVPTMLLAAARSERGAIRRRLELLGEAHLGGGQSLGAALAHAAPALPERVLSQVAAAERIGRLGPTLRRLSAERFAALRHQSQDVASTAGFTATYALLLSLALASGVGFVGVFIMPKFQKIFEDFNVKLPWITVVTMRLAYEVGPAFLLAAVGVLCGVLAKATWDIFMSQWGEPFRGVGLLDSVKWCIPLLRQAERDRGLADACELAAQGLRAGLPLDRAVGEAAEVRMNRHLQRRVQHWAIGLARGQPAGDAARQAGLPALVAGLVGTAQAGSAMEAALDFLARYYRQRFSRVALLVRGALVPGLVLTLGAVVGWVVVSVFLPLVALIRAVTPVWGY